jgi:hypothetical protein
MLDARLRRLNENLRLVARRAQHALDPKDFVADGIAIAKRGKHLMDGRRHLTRAASARAAARPAAAAMWTPPPLLALSGVDGLVLRLSLAWRPLLVLSAWSGRSATGSRVARRLRSGRP